MALELHRHPLRSLGKTEYVGFALKEVGAKGLRCELRNSSRTTDWSLLCNDPSILNLFQEVTETHSRLWLQKRARLLGLELLSFENDTSWHTSTLYIREGYHNTYPDIF